MILLCLKFDNMQVTKNDCDSAHLGNEIRIDVWNIKFRTLNTAAHENFTSRFIDMSELKDALDLCGFKVFFVNFF